jgi:tripeptide aminopeptidase
MTTSAHASLPEIDPQAALARFTTLAAIEGISGKERAVMAQIISMLVAAGVDELAIQYDDANTRSHIGGEVGNLIVDLPGMISGPATLLSAHADTVPVCLGSSPVIDGDEVKSALDSTGLGADDRAGCAVIITAVSELLRSGLPYRPIKLLFFIQEEIGLCGARHLDPSRLGKIDRAFNFDGGSLDKLTVGATGGERITVNLHGVAAHAGVAPQTGASAIVMAAEAIHDLYSNGWLGRVDKPGLGVGTANVGVISGGDATNVITPTLTLRAEARSHDAAMRQRIVEEIGKAFRNAAASVKTDKGVSGRVEIQSRVDYESFALAADDPSVLAAESAIKALGRNTYHEVSNGGLDANWLHRHGIPAVTLGCGQKNIHTIDERLVIADYLDACRVAFALIAN